MTATLLAIALSALLTAQAAQVAPAAPGPRTLHDVLDTAWQRTVKLYGASIAGEHGYGTGVLVSAEGDVITVLSLLLEARNLRAVTSDGHVYAAEVRHRDEYRQLALLRLSRHAENVDTDAPVREQMARKTFDFYPLEASPEVHAGDWVLAIGNPFKVAEGDERLSIMRGIVSGVTRMDAERGVQAFPYRGDILLLDAITSGPGSAGSAVVDASGRLVGMAGKAVTAQLTNTLLNYAYPVSELRQFLRDAEAASAPGTRPAPAATDAKPGYHGIQLSRIAYRRELPFVSSVARGSPAAEAGVKADDLIVSANGVAIPRGRVFQELCERLRPGDELALIIKRGEQLVPIRVVLSEPPR